MKKIYTTFLLLVCCITLNAQEERANKNITEGEILFRDQVNKTFNLIRVPATFPQRENTNAIIEKMAEVFGKQEFSTVWNYAELTSIEKHDKTLKISVSIKSLDFIHNYNQHYFNYFPYLIPDRMNFRVQLINESIEILYEESFYDIDVSNLKVGHKFIQIADIEILDNYSDQNISLRINEIVSPRPLLLFYHSDKRKRALFDFTNTIRDYEKDTELISVKREEIQNININDIENLSSSLRELEEIKSIIDFISEKDHSSRLNLKENDPSDMLKKKELFYTAYHETKKIIQQTLKKLDEAWYNKGMEHLRQGDQSTATEMFERAVSINPHHVEANYRLAEIDFRQNRFDDAMERSMRMVSVMNPGIKTSNELYTLINLIEDTLIKKRNKVYAGMVDLVDQSLKTGNTEKALESIRKALSYQNEYRLYILDKEDAVIVLERIIRHITANAEKLVASELYTKALEEYSDIIDLLEELAPELTDFKKIKERIHEILLMYIEKKMSQANQAIIQKEFAKAEKLIYQLTNYRDDFLSTDKSFPALDNLVEQYQSSIFTESLNNLYNGYYTKALELLNRCFQFGEMNDLRQPEDIHKYLNEARIGAFTSILFSGRQAMNKRDFKAAAFYLEEAIGFIGQHNSKTASTALEAYKSNLLTAYVAEGRKYLQFKDFSKAIDFFDKAQKLQYRYDIFSDENISALVIEAMEGICIEMLKEAEKYLYDGDYVYGMDALRSAHKYFKENSLSGRAAGQMAITADHFFRTILSETDNNIREQLYKKALHNVGRTRYLCSNFSIRCDISIVEQRERDIYQGIYNLKIADAEKALNSGDMGQAESLIDEAYTFRQNYSHFISNNEPAEQLLSQILYKKYQNHITTGKDLSDRQEYRQALHHFDEAVKLESQGGFTIDSEMHRLRREAALNTLLLEAEQLNKMLDESSFMGTKDKLLNLFTLRANYGLEENKVLSLRLNDIQKRMVSSECKKFQEKYDSCMTRAYSYARERNFIAAGKTIVRAKEIASERADCYISDSSAVRYMIQLTPAIKYQTKLREAEELLKHFKDSDALKAYLEAEHLYHSGNVRIYGLEHIPFTEFVLKQNLNFILTAAYYYYDKRDLQMTFNMISELENRGYPSSQTRFLQDQIGFQMGVNDRKNYPSSKWQEKVLEYTEGKNFYGYFRRAYRKGWRSAK